MTLEPFALRGIHVNLEPLALDHLPRLCEAGLDADLWRWAPSVISTPDEMSGYVQTALQMQREGTALPYVNIDCPSGRIIGSTRFANIDMAHRRVEIGWTWIARPWQRTAINTEMKYLMLKHAFEVFGCMRVELKTDSLNQRSRMAILRIGAKEEGVLRNHMLTQGGRIRHTVYYSVIDSEWPSVKSMLEEKLRRVVNVIVQKRKNRVEISVTNAYPWCVTIGECTMSQNVFKQQSLDYLRIEKAISFLQSNYTRQPDLREVARSVHLSEYHFQRLFTRWAGISPKKFLQYLTVEHAKRSLKESRSVLDATFDAGLSSPGRLHDLFVAVEAMTPGEFKQSGEGLTIYYGFHATPFGECLLAVTGRGICGLSFVPEGTRTHVLAELRDRWTGAALRESPEKTRPFIDALFSRSVKKRREPLQLLLKGTNFQVKVWEALMRIPEGRVVSYEDLAQAVGNPGASRAVGNAVGKNPIAYIIPCHRVIKRVGVIGNYHWGPERKKALLGWEWAKTGSTSEAPSV